MINNKVKERVRAMRLILFFDLPVETSKQRKEYRIFRKFLIKNGYVMQQLSIYSKLELNDYEYKSDIKKLKANKPKTGSIQALRVTEKQFASIDYILGEKMYDDFEDSFEGLVII